MEAFIQIELNGWLKKYETVWRQKSRETWLKDGDKNSRFFHLTTIIRRRRNAIDAIKFDNGEWITNKADIKEFILLKFQHLFNEEAPYFPPDFENLITTSVTPQENDHLCTISSAKDIKDTLFEMQSFKAPGPDGLPVLFYKHYWSIVGHNVINAVQKFFRSGHLLMEVNNSLIVLIPKNSAPSNVNHFRPISLCNTIYKVIAKFLVSKLRPLLANLISPGQSAFVLDRWIAENQLVFHELLHSFKQRKVKGGFVAMKVDLQKASDRVNWSFLKTVLLKFGFHEVFVCQVMQCVSTVSFSVLVNGGKSKCFQPSRGLRQGDPLSSYLFILCQEVLSRLIDKEFATGVISGVSMNRNGLAFTNVTYADDIMLFAKANNREVQALDACHGKYCQWSGQLVSREKSGLIFSKLVSRERKREIKLELNMKTVPQNANYLGAPFFSTRNRSKDFKFLQDKLESKLKG